MAVDKLHSLCIDWLAMADSLAMVTKKSLTATGNPGSADYAERLKLILHIYAGGQRAALPVPVEPHDGWSSSTVCQGILLRRNNHPTDSHKTAWFCYSSLVKGFCSTAIEKIENVSEFLFLESLQTWKNNCGKTAITVYHQIWAFRDFPFIVLAHKLKD